MHITIDIYICIYVYMYACICTCTAYYIHDEFWAGTVIYAHMYILFYAIHQYVFLWHTSIAYYMHMSQGELKSMDLFVHTHTVHAYHCIMYMYTSYMHNPIVQHMYICMYIYAYALYVCMYVCMYMLKYNAYHCMLTCTYIHYICIYTYMYTYI
jgi:hypothetical protein